MSRSLQRFLILGFLFILLGPGPAEGARYPVLAYTSADGLSHDMVHGMLADRSGYLWFCTQEGLSRFDGREFVLVGADQGLGRIAFSDLLEAADGTYWAATSRGLLRFNPSRRPGKGGSFDKVELQGAAPGEGATRVVQDRSGRIWVGTSNDLYVLEPAGRSWHSRRIALRPPLKGSMGRILSLAEGSDGRIWAGTQGEGLFRTGEEHLAERFLIDKVPTGRANNIRGLVSGQDGNLWAATFGGLVEIRPDPSGEPPTILHFYTSVLPSLNCSGVYQRKRGEILVATAGGVVELHPGRSASDPWRPARVLTAREGLSSELVSCFAEDSAGSLWMGTDSQGVMALLAGGFTRYDELSGPGIYTHDIFEDEAGRTGALLYPRDMDVVIRRREGSEFRSIPVMLPPSVTYLGWGVSQKILRDRSGDWWLATGQGVCRFAGARSVQELSRRLPSHCYGKDDGLPGGDIFRMFPDSRGDIWVSTSQDRSESTTVGRWRSAEGRMESIPLDILDDRSLAMQFAEDPQGNVWISFSDGRVARYREGRFELFGARELLDRRRQGGAYLDHRGRLWLLGDPVVLVEKPGAERPTFVPYQASDELNSRSSNCAVDDASGRLYFGTNRGVVRVEPETGRSRVFTIRDGLPGNLIVICHRDSEGGLWFSDAIGVSELSPSPDSPPAPPPQVRIGAVRVGGVPQPLASLGETRVGPLVLPSGGRPVSVDYAAPELTPGVILRYQFLLKGLPGGWSAPGESRSLQLARLSPGSYRLLVRAVTGEGEVSPKIAEVILRVPEPIWLQGWFLALAALLTAALAYGAYRIRVARLLELERIRTRIATDLHDDIGSSLSQITILSQLARRGAGSAESGGLLDRITQLSGELVDAMSDVVWAISPGRDHLSDLLHRMRRFATELFAEEEILLRLALPEPARDERIHSDLRRNLFLVFKEALHNVLRHSGATQVEVELRGEDGDWLLRVRDDGRGMDPGRKSAGHGLESMRRRAESVGGDLRIESRPGGGTEVVFRIGRSAGRRRKLSQGIVAGPPAAP